MPNIYHRSVWRFIAANAVLGLSLLLSACGGGSGGNQVSGIDGSGSPATSTTGTISGFGSVIVNGIRYHTDKANFSVNDQTGTEIDLHTGYQVHITGTLNKDGTGEASSIEFHSNIVGAISAIDTAANQIIVLGQTVNITNATMFGANIVPNYIDGLKVNDVVQVSGQTNSQNILVATRIDSVVTNLQRVTGTIAHLTDTTFTLNNLTVNYASANFANIVGNHLTNDISVFVTGSVNSNGVLIAQTVRQLENNLRSGSNHGEIEGFISRFGSAIDFDIAGVTCTTDNNTTYDNGSSATLALNVQAEIEGDLNSAGKLLAKKIQFHQTESRILAGQVTSITTDASGAIVTATLQVAGVTIQTNALTRVEDKSTSELKKFNVGNIQVNEFVKVTGYTSNGNFIATQIERDNENENNPLRIEGIVTAVRFDGFNINDRSVTLVDQTELHGLNSALLTRVNFLAIALNKNVEVRGILNNGTFTATRVDIKSD